MEDEDEEFYQRMSKVQLTTSNLLAPLREDFYTKWSNDDPEIAAVFIGHMFALFRTTIALSLISYGKSRGSDEDRTKFLGFAADAWDEFHERPSSPGVKLKIVR